MNLQTRTKEQLLADFDGPQEGSIKMLNLIHSLFAAIEANAPPTPPTPVPYSEEPANLAGALVNAGLMEADEE